MITPINGHLLIKPLVHESFTATQNETYQEIGEVIAIDKNIQGIEVGYQVYFDAWLAAKFPSDNPEKPYWLVKYEDIRAYAEPK